MVGICDCGDGRLWPHLSGHPHRARDRGVLNAGGIALIGLLTATVASYFVGQHADTTNVEREKLREELAKSRDERDQLLAKLEPLSAQMDELLLSVASNREQGRLSREGSSPAGAQRRRQG